MEPTLEHAPDSLRLKKKKHIIRLASCVYSSRPVTIIVSNDMCYSHKTTSVMAGHNWIGCVMSKSYTINLSNTN